MEERLREDVIKEVGTFQGLVLIHDETSEGAITSRWERVYMFALSFFSSSPPSLLVVVIILFMVAIIITEMTQKIFKLLKMYSKC